MSRLNITTRVEKILTLAEHWVFITRLTYISHASRQALQQPCLFCIKYLIHYHQPLNCEGCWGTTDDFATSFLHFPLFSTVLWDLPNFRPVHSLMLSSHFFLCLPCLLPPFTVPCKMALARHNEWKTCLYQLSLHLFMMVRIEVFVQSDCLMDLGTYLLVRNMVFV